MPRWIEFTGKERDSDTQLDYFGARYYDSEIGHWMSPDPLKDKYPGWSPYNYCLDNPLKFVDPDGKAIGDYYNENGELIGSDGKDDNKNYVVPNNKLTTVSTALDVKAAGYENIASLNSVLLPDVNVISSMESVANTAGQFNEVGGGIATSANGGQGVIAAVPGTNADPSQESQVSINVYAPANPNDWANYNRDIGAFHTHPSGRVRIGNATYSFDQPPSQTDINNAAERNYPLNNYVISDKVYIYNGGGTIASMPINAFYGLGR
ncbi:MAG: RHS repeat-associated core domain-containing protein [Clostridiales bacterium]